MTMVHTTRTRWLSGTVLLAVMVVLLTGCTSRMWSMSYATSTSGRAPETFAVACAEINGLLVDRAESAEESAQSLCTVRSGDKITCDWTLQTCLVECFTSEEACASSVQFMGYVPPPLSGTPVARIPAPTDVAVLGAAPPSHLAIAIWS